MIIKEKHIPRDIRKIQHVPLYLGFMLPGDEDYGNGPYVIVHTDLDKNNKTCTVLNCDTHLLRKIPWDTMVVLIKISLDWVYAIPGENI